jgi:hypothetical protein
MRLLAGIRVEPISTGRWAREGRSMGGLFRVARRKLPCAPTPCAHAQEDRCRNESEMAPQGFGIAQNGLRNGSPSRERAPAAAQGAWRKPVRSPSPASDEA